MREIGEMRGVIFMYATLFAGAFFVYAGYHI